MNNETYFYNIDAIKTFIKKKIYNGQEANLKNTKKNIQFLTECLIICRPEYYSVFRDELGIQIEILSDLIDDIQ